MEQIKTKWDFYTFPDNEYFITKEMSEEEAYGYCIRFDLTKRRAKR